MSVGGDLFLACNGEEVLGQDWPGNCALTTYDLSVEALVDDGERSLLTVHREWLALGWRAPIHNVHLCSGCCSALAAKTVDLRVCMCFPVLASGVSGVVPLVMPDEVEDWELFNG